ncbi:hypothetical protein COLO4_11071 [Corchorus olitorius]|uniref:Uncharacterized protein n=1 Tax=Corchorus olitorius TaxID=93759 RepID=A0A1R3K5U1_9ROSI|nr:hypothetical protein COLO4_11071 [Corchorus olitorius]
MPTRAMVMSRSSRFPAPMRAIHLISNAALPAVFVVARPRSQAAAACGPML